MVRLVRNSLFLLLLVGCLTPKKADRQLLNIAAKYPEKIAKKSSIMFPIRERTDTIENTEYDFIEVLCDTFWNIGERRDTVILTKKVQVPSKTITITHTVEDQAAIHAMQNEISRLNSKLLSADDRGDFYYKWYWILICACIVLFCSHLIRK